MKVLCLTKITDSQWQGNGFGSSTAEWVVKGNEHISVNKISGFWRAVDTRCNKILVRYATTRNELIKDLTDVL
jgi:hypothetical protein